MEQNNYFRNWKKYIKIIIYCFIFFAVIISFKDSIQEIIKTTFADKIFKDFNATIEFDIAILITFLFSIIYLIKNLFNRLFPTCFSLIVLTFFALAYNDFRESSRYKLIELYLSNKCSYIDVAFIAISILTVRYKRYGKLNVDKDKFYFYEDIFRDDDKDLFDREGTAEQLASIICNSSSERAIAISIIGNWGIGKTAFMKMVKMHLIDDCNNEILEFNPWKVADTKKNIETFFESLAFILGKYDLSARSQLRKYSSILTEIEDESWYSKIPKAIARQFNEVDINEQYNNINSAIISTGKRFIVFVDDLDRITGSEIIQILKLIRNVANFGNLFFIVGVDIEYVTISLQKTNDISSESKYLEKIFQHQVILPPIKKEYIRNQLENLLRTNLMPLDEQKDFEQVFDSLLISKNENVNSIYTGNFFETDFERVIANRRDLIRLVNSFQLSYKILKDEVDLRDLLLLEAIKVKSPIIYQKLANRSLLEISDDNPRQFLVGKEFKKIETTDDPDLKAVLELVKSLFGHRNKNHERAIVYPQSFEIYFYYQLFDNISIIEFREATKKSEKELYDQIQEWRKEGKGESAEQIISNKTIFANWDEFSYYIKIFLLIGDSPNNRQWIVHAYSLFDRPHILANGYNIGIDDVIKLPTDLVDDSDITHYARSEFSSLFLINALQLVAPYKPIRYWLDKNMEILIDFVKLNIDKPFNLLVYELVFNVIESYTNDNKHEIFPAAYEQLGKYIKAKKEEYGPYIIRPYSIPPDKNFTFDPWLVSALGGNDPEVLISFFMSIESEDLLVKLARTYLPNYIDAFKRNNGHSFFTINNESDRKLIVDLRKKLFERS